MGEGLKRARASAQKSQSLKPTEREALRFADQYGPMIDFGGSGHSRLRKAAASLIERGLLAGQVRSARITEAGKKRLNADAE